MINNNAAILLFSRTATAEAAAKPLALGKRSAESVAAFMVNHAKKLAADTQQPVFFFSEKQQRGTTFGERFANAFEDVFALGFSQVISIGNDCLTVTTKDILTAVDALETTPSSNGRDASAVLGATTDGGAYLIGFQKNVFQKEAFQNIHWQTDGVFDELIQFVENQNFNTLFLSPKTDIDRVSDWKKTFVTVAFSLKKILDRLLFFRLPMPSAKDILPINAAFLTGAIALRAPPSSVFRNAVSECL